MSKQRDVFSVPTKNKTKKRETRRESTHFDRDEKKLDLRIVTFRHGNVETIDFDRMVSPIGTPTKRAAEEDERAKTRRGRRLFIWHAVVAVIGAFATTAGGQHKAGRR